MKMIEIVNEKLEVMVVPPGKIPAGWTRYTGGKKFPTRERRTIEQIRARLTGKDMT
jgi:hypothetical protein